LSHSAGGELATDRCGVMLPSADSWLRACLFSVCLGSLVTACATNGELPEYWGRLVGVDGGSASSTNNGNSNATAGSTSSGGVSTGGTLSVGGATGGTNATAGTQNDDPDAGVVGNGGSTVTPMAGNGGVASAGAGGVSSGGAGAGGTGAGGAGGGTVGNGGNGGSVAGGGSGGAPAGCSGLPAWSGATAYAMGDEVVSTCSGAFATTACPEGATHSFRCDAEQIELPWCQQRQPGVTNGWDVIWTDLGVCE